jgi:hypothetical protein
MYKQDLNYIQGYSVLITKPFLNLTSRMKLDRRQLPKKSSNIYNN